MSLRKTCVWSLTCLAFLPACASERASEAEVTVQSAALNAQTINVQLTLPAGLTSAGFLVAQNKVQLDSGVTVASPVWSAGTVVMQPDAKAQAITATGNVSLADRDKVDTITFGGTLTKGNGDVIGAAAKATLTNVTRSTSITFPATNDSLIVNSGQIKTLSPGSYINLNVSSSATLVLSAGDYYVSNLTLESGANLKLNPAAGATRIFVASSIALRSNPVSGADASRLFIEYLGSNAVTLSTAFAGTLIAPRTTLNLASLNGGAVHRGSFMAQTIEVQPNAKVEFVPFNPAGTASSCAGDAWDPDGNPFTSCVAKTVCAPGSYVSAEGSSTSDRVCTGCASGQFSASANAPSCTAWTNCVAGTFVSGAPSATADRACSACAEGQFSSGDNQSACVSQGACDAGTVQSAAGTATSAAVCTACAAGQYCAGGTNPAVACAAGTWDNDGDAATACVPKSICVAGATVASEGDAVTDRSCAACASGTFSATENAPICVAWTDCLAGSYVTNTPSTTLDRACSPCPADQYSNSDNQTSCQLQGSCAAGTLQTAPGTATAPATCVACDPGTYCAGDLTPAVVCGSGSWDNDANAATPCVTATQCAPGSYVVAEATAVTDRVCAACDLGAFSTASNAAVCATWTSCPVGTYVSNTPSATADRICTACPEGQTSSGENAASCSDISEPGGGAETTGPIL